MRALISVYNKSGLTSFAKQLVDLGWEILSTGGTAVALREKKIPVTDVSDVTHFPEILDGRVKTLHPNIHGGILANRSKKEHQKALENQNIEPIDLVVVNLYPFESTPTIENIDIGGPTMVRAAAKNYEDVLVVVDPKDYKEVLSVAGKDATISLEFRKRLAAKAFARTAEYERAIADYFNEEKEFTTLRLTMRANLRYGENPHQKAAFFQRKKESVYWGKPLQGKELSYNNILDADAAFQLISEFKDDPFACSIIKHSNPCGVATSKDSLADAFLKAKSCDPLSAFGGIVAFNRKVDGKTAEMLAEMFLEVVLAPGYSEEAESALAKKKNLRLLVANLSSIQGDTYRSAGGGLLQQSADTVKEDSSQWKVQTKRTPTDKEKKAMQFAWKVCKHVRSNAIVFATTDQILGIGAGQTSRVDAVKVAIMKMKQTSIAPSHHPAKQPAGRPTIALASDAFFPFPDGVEEAAKAGATAVIQPGGSVKDNDVIAAADQNKLAMLFTGVRHFRH